MLLYTKTLLKAEEQHLKQVSDSLLFNITHTETLKPGNIDNHAHYLITPSDDICKLVLLLLPSQPIPVIRKITHSVPHLCIKCGEPEIYAEWTLRSFCKKVYIEIRECFGCSTFIWTRADIQNNYENL